MIGTDRPTTVEHQDGFVVEYFPDRKYHHFTVWRLGEVFGFCETRGDVDFLIKKEIKSVNQRLLRKQEV